MINIYKLFTHLHIMSVISLRTSFDVCIAVLLLWNFKKHNLLKFKAETIRTMPRCLLDTNSVQFFVLGPV